MKSLSKRLILDTATKSIYLALYLGDEELQVRYQEGLNDHSVTLLPMLEEMLNTIHWKLEDLNEIYIGIGPGSYTGVRIGVSVAKMIGFMHPIDIYTVSSLFLLASSSDSSEIVAFIDARRNNAFMAYYKQNNHILTEVISDCLENIDLFLTKVSPLATVIKQGCPKGYKVFSSRTGQKVSELHDLVPNYLQITEAERKKG